MCRFAIASVKVRLSGHLCLLMLVVNVSLISYSPGAMGLDLDPTDKVLFFADSGSPGSPN